VVNEHEHGRDAAVAALEADKAAYDTKIAAAKAFRATVANGRYGVGDVDNYLRNNGVSLDAPLNGDEFPLDDLNAKGLAGLRERRTAAYAERLGALRAVIVKAANEGLISNAQRDAGFEAIGLDALKTVTRVTLGRVEFTLDGEVARDEVRNKLAAGLGNIMGNGAVADVDVTVRTVVA
jgi:hypothetical protein